MIGNIAEQFLNTIITYVIQDGTALTVERIMQLEETHRKFTLGHFIKKLRERATIDVSVEDAFNQYLEGRNTILHRFSEVPGSAMDSDEEILKVLGYVHKVAENMNKVMIFSMGLIQSWARQNNFPDNLDITNQDIDPGIKVAILEAMGKMNTLIMPKQ